MAFSGALVIATVSLALGATSEDGTVLALRLTGRWSYLWFWGAYTTGAWATLLGPRWRDSAYRARDFGLGFAAAHLVHLVLVIWLYRIAVHPPSTRTLEIFGVAVFFTYLLALLSFRTFASLVPRRALPVVRTVAVEYIALAFVIDFATHPIAPTLQWVLSYGLFVGLILIGYGVRIAALAQRHASAPAR